VAKNIEDTIKYCDSTRLRHEGKGNYSVFHLHFGGLPDPRSSVPSQDRRLCITSMPLVFSRSITLVGLLFTINEKLESLLASVLLAITYKMKKKQTIKNNENYSL